jgi:hypothetical protein
MEVSTASTAVASCARRGAAPSSGRRIAAESQMFSSTLSEAYLRHEGVKEPG